MAGINRTTGKATDLITFSRASGGTYLDSDGLLKTASTNIPRIEYDADGNVKGLLVEEARTNLLTYSEAFDNAAWSTSLLLPFGSGSSANAAVAPDGTTSADLIVPTTDSSNVHYIRSTAQPALATGVSGTFSIFVKAAGYTTLSLRLVNTDAPIINYDLEAVSADSASGTISAIGNGWFRCSITGVGTGSSAWPWIYPNQQATYAGDGTSGIYIYGAQFEAGSFPTSYIPTSGSTATRAADIASISVDNFGYNQKAGTVVVEFDSNGSDGADYPRVFSLSNSAGTDLSRFLINPTNTTTVAVIKSSVGVALTGWSGSISPNAEEKVAVSMKKDSFAASLSGASTQTDTSGDMPSTADLLAIGTQSNLANNYLNGHIKSIAYYPRRLSNAQLQELTA